METKSAIRAHSAKKFKSKVFKKWINANLDMKQNHEVKLNSTFFPLKLNQNPRTSHACMEKGLFDILSLLREEKLLNFSNVHI